jgi:mitochondrial translocator assembly and maintenance protein 41
MQIDFESLKATLDKTFPKIEFIIAYGSSIFPQEGYDYRSEKPLIDLLFVVNDADKFHKENFEKNRNHYTGLGYLLGPFFLKLLRRNFFPIHFNPLITVNDFSFKYGVIDHQEFLFDLKEWDMISLAGRLQKPVMLLKQPDSDRRRREFSIALNENRQSALAVSLLLNINEHVIEEFILYETLVSLSYTGDIR